jgi:hypothetical protein
MDKKALISTFDTVLEQLEDFCREHRTYFHQQALAINWVNYGNLQRLIEPLCINEPIAISEMDESEISFYTLDDGEQLKQHCIPWEWLSNRSVWQQHVDSTLKTLISTTLANEQ